MILRLPTGFFFLLFILSFVACQKKEKEQVSPVKYVSPESRDRVKRIVAQYGPLRKYKITLDFHYNNMGLVDTIKLDQGNSTSYPEITVIEYEGNKVSKEIVGNYDHNTYQLRPLKEANYYYSAGYIKYYTIDYKGFNGLNRYENGEFYYDGIDLSYIVTNHKKSGHLIVDTLNYTQSSEKGEEVTLKTVPTSAGDCSKINYRYSSTSSAYSYKGTLNCDSSYQITGEFSNVKNNVQKPVYDALMYFLSPFDPFDDFLERETYELQRMVFYKPYSMPEYFIKSINGNGLGSVSFDYTTDSSGRVSTITTYEYTGEVLVKVMFEY